MAVGGVGSGGGYGSVQGGSGYFSSDNTPGATGAAQDTGYLSGATKTGGYATQGGSSGYYADGFSGSGGAQNFLEGFDYTQTYSMTQLRDKTKGQLSLLEEYVQYHDTQIAKAQGKTFDPNNNKTDAAKFQRDIQGYLRKFMQKDPAYLGTAKQQQSDKEVQKIFKQWQSQGLMPKSISVDGQSITDMSGILANIDQSKRTAFFTHVSILLKKYNLPSTTKNYQAGKPFDMPPNSVIPYKEAQFQNQLISNLNGEYFDIQKWAQSGKPAEQKKALEYIKKLLSGKDVNENMKAPTGSQKDLLLYLQMYAAGDTGNSALQESSAKSLSDSSTATSDMKQAAKQTVEGIATWKGEMTASNAFQQGGKLYQQALKELNSGNKAQSQKDFENAYYLLKQANDNSAFSAQNNHQELEMMGYAAQLSGNKDLSSKTDSILQKYANSGATGPDVQNAKDSVKWDSESTGLQNNIFDLYNEAIKYPGYEVGYINQIKGLMASHPLIAKEFPTVYHLLVTLQLSAGLLNDAQQSLDAMKSNFAGMQKTNPDYATTQKFITQSQQSINGPLLLNPQGQLSNFFQNTLGMSPTLANKLAGGVTSPWVNHDKLDQWSAGVIEKVMEGRSLRTDAAGSGKWGYKGWGHDELEGEGRGSYFIGSGHTKELYDNYTQELEKGKKDINDVRSEFERGMYIDRGMAGLPESMKRSLGHIFNWEADGKTDVKKLGDSIDEALKKLGEIDKQSPEEQKATRSLRSRLENAKEKLHRAKTRVDIYNTKLKKLKEDQRSTKPGGLAESIARGFSQLKKELNDKQNRTPTSTEEDGYGYFAGKVHEAGGDPSTVAPAGEFNSEQTDFADAQASLANYRAALETNPQAAETLYTQAMEQEQSGSQARLEKSQEALEQTDKSNPAAMQEAQIRLYQNEAEVDVAGVKVRFASSRGGMSPEMGWWGFGQSGPHDSITDDVYNAGRGQDNPWQQGGAGHSYQASETATAEGLGLDARTYSMNFMGSWNSFTYMEGAQARAVAFNAASSVNYMGGSVTIDGNPVYLVAGNAMANAGLVGQADSTAEASFHGLSRLALTGSAGAYAGFETQGTIGASALGLGMNAMGQFGFGIGASANAGITMQKGVLHFDLGFRFGFGPMVGLQFNPTINFNKIAKEGQYIMQDGVGWGETKKLFSGAASEIKKGDVVGGAVEAAGGALFGIGAAVTGGIKRLFNW